MNEDMEREIYIQNQEWQTRFNGKLEDEYQIYLMHAIDKPLKTFDEWIDQGII